MKHYGSTPYDELMALRAQILEYEHALDHVIECGACEDCKSLSQSALNGGSREDFLEIVVWSGTPRERNLDE